MTDRPSTPAPAGEDAAPDDATRVVSRGEAAAQVSGATIHPSGVLATGTRLGEFEITVLIGQGGFGAVYEAWDHVLERTVAIKEYLPSALSLRQPDGSVAPLSERQRETFDLGMRSFINEARLLAQFDHPSLLKVYRFWEERGTTYMVMPLYRGHTLRQALTQRAGADGVSEAWLLQVADGVTQALAVMHAANCFHRDIAPDNIMLLDDGGRPVVLDFGAARRVISDKTQAITVILKPGYAPVEQYAEMPDMKQGPWTDVYALAAVLHVMVSGKSPPPSVARVMADGYAPLAGNEALAARFSQRLLTAIDLGLAVRPEHRPQSMAEFRQRLGLDGSPPPNTVMDAQVRAPTSFPAPTERFAAEEEATSLIAHAPAPRMMPPPPAGGAVRASAAPSLRGWWIAGALGVALLVAGGAWLALRPPPSLEESAPVAANAPAPPDPVVPAPAAPAQETPPPEPKTPLQSLQAMQQHATSAFGVQATPVQARVQIGKDALAFDVRSQREGFVYVYLLSSGGEMLMLFPNQLDRHNRILPSETFRLPRASWPMTAGGPRGVNHFAVVVSAHERDFSETGAQSDGVFSQFSPSVLAALEAANTGNGSPLLGKVVCPNAQTCGNDYGVAYFSVTEE